MTGARAWRKILGRWSGAKVTSKQSTGRTHLFGNLNGLKVVLVCERRLGRSTNFSPNLHLAWTKIHRTPCCTTKHPITIVRILIRENKPALGIGAAPEAAVPQILQRGFRTPHFRFWRFQGRGMQAFRRACVSESAEEGFTVCGNPL